MIFHLLRQSSRAILALALICVVCFLGAGKSSQERGITSKDETILGITLGASTAEDVKRTLGPATVRESRNHDTLTSCYIGKDGTVLEITYWIDEPIEFILSYASDRGDYRCADSSLVSRESATASGLKLGMTIREVIRILGRPSRKTADHFVYEVTTERPPSTEETKEFKTKGGPPWEVKMIQIYQKVKIDFRSSKAVSIAVTHTETL